MRPVFLSHSSADSAAAKAVAQLLRDAGVPAWLDRDQLVPGARWSSDLEAALKGSSHFVVLVGEAGVPRWVDREIHYAIDRNTGDPRYRVIPLLGPGAKVDALPLFLKQHQYLQLDWSKPDPQAIQRIAAAILDAPPERVSVLPPGESPFRGLLPFDTEHSLMFFGRDREVDELVALLQKYPFLPVVGDSGSGKSSLVRAGVIPALLRGRDMIDWRIATMMPGQDPLEKLAAAVPQFNPALGPDDRLKLFPQAKLRLREGGIDGLSEILDAALQLPASSRQLLVVDQFEQLFTLAQRENGSDDAARFIDTVLHSAQRPNSTLKVMITLRADFFGLCHPYPELWRLLTRQHYSVRRMEPDCLREVIVKPMALAGVTLEPGLADTMIAEAGVQPGALALLEHALDQLWRECKGGELTSKDYENIGRLEGAIRKHADWVLDERLGKGQREMARRIFVELTALAERADYSARRVLKDKLDSLPGDGAKEVLKVLTDERLVTVSGAEETIGGAEGQEVSVAHDALVRGWKRLHLWVDERQQDILFQRDLERAEEAWRKAGNDKDLLWRGGRLEHAIQWKEGNPNEVTPEVDRFIRASRNRHRRDRAFLWGPILLLAAGILVAALPEIKRGLHHAQGLLTYKRINPKDGLKYVYIPPGDFQMGCVGSTCRGEETPRHQVHISNRFWIGQTEVTQAAYKKVIGDVNALRRLLGMGQTETNADPSTFKGDDRPVENVSWEDADRYCKAVGMRLPTEAEWEYAARAGNPEDTYGEVDRIAVYAGKSGGRSAKIRSKSWNPWGLNDMLGNVWEWTNDWYDNYKISRPDEVVVDPKGPEDKDLKEKVLRGGSWFDDAQNIRVSLRVGSAPSARDSLVGFRCAGELP